MHIAQFIVSLTVPSWPPWCIYWNYWTMMSFHVCICSGIRQWNGSGRVLLCKHEALSSNLPIPAIPALGVQRQADPQDLLVNQPLQKMVALWFTNPLTKAMRKHLTQCSPCVLPMEVSCWKCFSRSPGRIFERMKNAYWFLEDHQWLLWLGELTRKLLPRALQAAWDTVTALHPIWDVCSTRVTRTKV